MSLINDALKRAQQEREKQMHGPSRGLLQHDTPESAARKEYGSPTQPQFSMAQPVGRSTGIPILALVFGLIIGGSALAAAVAFGVFLYFQIGADEPESPGPVVTRQEVRLNPGDGASSTGVDKPTTPAEPAGSGDPVQLSNSSALARSLAVVTDPLAEIATASGSGQRGSPASAAPASSPSPVGEPAIEVSDRLGNSGSVTVATEPDPEIEALRKELEALRLELASVQAPRESSMQPSPSVSQEGVSSVQAIQEAAGDAGRDPGLIDSGAAPVNPEMAGDDTQAAVSARPSTTEPMPSVQEYVRQASVTGIRLSGPSPKVVLNNRVYRLNENVLDSQGIPIRIVGIERTTITFEDEYGFRYTKRF